MHWIISASVVAILLVAMAPLAMANPDHEITYEPETIYVGDEVEFEAYVVKWLWDWWHWQTWATRWDFDDGDILVYPSGEGWTLRGSYYYSTASHVYTEAGDYTVLISMQWAGWIRDRLRVTITVLPRVPATVDINPDTLTLKSKGKWITAYIELPDGYDVADIDLSTIRLNEVVPADLKPTEIGDHDADGIADLMVKFSRADVGASLSAGGEVELTVTGELVDGTPFEGSDTIRVISPNETIQKGGRKP